MEFDSLPHFDSIYYNYRNDVIQNRRYYAELVQDLPRLMDLYPTNNFRSLHSSASYVLNYSRGGEILIDTEKLKFIDCCLDVEEF